VVFRWVLFTMDQKKDFSKLTILLRRVIVCTGSLVVS